MFCATLWRRAKPPAVCRSMKYTSTLGLTMSGSAGGLTASHNKGGQYIRRRAIPTNPSTSAQEGVRQRMTAASTAYRTLSPSQVESWATYAANTPVRNSLGETRTLSGAQWHASYYTTYTRSGLAGPTTAPTTSGRADPVSVQSAGLDGADLVVTLETSTPSGGGVQVYMSRPQSQGVTFFKGPFRYLDTVGSGASLLVAAASLPWPLVVGEKVFFRTVTIEAITDGGRTSRGVVQETILMSI